MKRRDWKIKKLKKNIYGKYTKKKRIFFLRKLFVRKNLVLFKKNSIPHFFFYNNILKNFFNRKISLIKKFYLFNNLNSFIVTPNFFFKKKIFGFNNNFLKFINKNNLQYIFMKENYFKKLTGINVLMFDNENKKNFNFLDNEDNKNIVVEKQKCFNIEFLTNLDKMFNFIFNFNIHLLTVLEIYKIIIILYINKLK